MSTVQVQPDTGEITVLMSEDEARSITAEIKAWAGTLWKKLKQAHDGQAWRALGYDSWRAYIDAEFDMGKSQAYRLLTHANAVYELAGAAGLTPDELSPAGDTIPERVTRGLDLDAVCEAIREAVMDLPRDATTATRAQLVEEITVRLRNPEPRPAPKPKREPAPVDPVAAAITNAAAAATKAADQENPLPPGAADRGQVPAPAPGHDSTTGPSSASGDDGTGDSPNEAGKPGAVELPEGWRDWFDNAARLLACDPDALGAALDHNRRADATDLIDLFTRALNHQEN